MVLSYQYDPKCLIYKLHRNRSEPIKCQDSDNILQYDNNVNGHLIHGLLDMTEFKNEKDKAFLGKVIRATVYITWFLL